MRGDRDASSAINIARNPSAVTETANFHQNPTLDHRLLGSERLINVVDNGPWQVAFSRAESQTTPALTNNRLTAVEHQSSVQIMLNQSFGEVANRVEDNEAVSALVLRQEDAVDQLSQRE